MRKLIVGSLIALAVLAIAGIAYGLTPMSGKLSFISGTEYAVNEDGQTIVRTTSTFGVPISATGCNVTIYYPNKTIWVNDVAMTQGGTSGSWYYTWTAPAITGSYEEYAQCGIAPNKIVGAGSSFHVSEALTNIGGNVTDINQNVNDINSTVSQILNNQNQPIATIIS